MIPVLIGRRVEPECRIEAQGVSKSTRLSHCMRVHTAATGE